MRISVDLNALVHNAALLKECVGDFYAVLKCDAYGHGATRCAEALYESGVRRYAVFSLSEALEIHPRVDSSDILILGRTDSAGFSTAAEKGFIQTVLSEEYASEIFALGRGIRLHLKVDTGMNRSGFFADGERVFSSVYSLKNNIEGVYTHFPKADAKDLCDTENRLSVFLKAAEELEVLLKRPLIKHSAASAAALRLPRARLDLSRIGLALYGVLPDNAALSACSCTVEPPLFDAPSPVPTFIAPPHTPFLYSPCVTPPALRPVMSLCGEVSGIRRVKKGETVGYGCRYVCRRDSVIATVDGGYANGIARSLVGRFMPRVRGRCVPLAAVCMDRCMLDVTEIFEEGNSVCIGEEVTFFGDEYSVREMASAADTIPYEILTLVGKSSRKG